MQHGEEFLQNDFPQFNKKRKWSKQASNMLENFCEMIIPSFI